MSPTEYIPAVFGIISIIASGVITIMVNKSKEQLQARVNSAEIRLQEIQVQAQAERNDTTIQSRLIDLVAAAVGSIEENTRIMRDLHQQSGEMHGTILAQRTEATAQNTRVEAALDTASKLMTSKADASELQRQQIAEAVRNGNKAILKALEAVQSRIDQIAEQIARVGISPETAQSLNDCAASIKALLVNIKPEEAK